MIAYVEGKLVEKTPTHAVIDCNGVAYHLHISLHTFSALADTGPCRLYAHLAVREDAHVLYGFSGREERDLFRKLISVSGIGPGTAQMILSSLSPNEVRKAITEGNVALLKSIKGIGAKTAERVIIDLRDKLSKMIYPGGEAAVLKTSAREEALSALAQLGVSRAQAERAVDKALAAGETSQAVESVIRLALKNL